MTLSEKRQNTLNSYAVADLYQENQGKNLNLILGSVSFFGIGKSEAPQMKLKFYHATDEVVALDKDIRDLFAERLELRQEAYDISEKMKSYKSASAVSKAQAKLDVLNDLQKTILEKVNQLRAEIENNHLVYINNKFVVAVSKPGLTPEEREDELNDKMLEGIRLLASFTGDAESDVFAMYSESIDKYIQAKQDQEKWSGLSYRFIKTVLSNMHKSLRKASAYTSVKLNVSKAYGSATKGFYGYATINSIGGQKTRKSNRQVVSQ